MNLPQSPGAELAVIGGAIFHPHLYPEIARRLKPHTFSDGARSAAWEAITALYDDGREEIDTILVAQAMVDGGAKRDHVNAVMQSVTSLEIAESAVVEHTETVVDSWRRRQLCIAAHRAIDKANDRTRNVGEAADYLRRIGESLDSSGADEAPDELADVLAEYAQRTKELLESGATPSFMTGIASLDTRMRIGRSSFIVVGARPKTGKSWLVKSILLGSAAFGRRGLLITNELTRGEVAQRIAATWGGARWLLDRDPILDDLAELDAIAARAKAEGVLFHIRYERSADRILAIMDAQVRRHPDTACVVVDYIQNAINLPRAWGDNDAARAAEFVLRLADFAKRREVCVIGVSSLNKPSKDTQHKRPTVSELFGTAKIEYAADAVLLLWRPAPAERPRRVEFWLAAGRHVRDNIRWTLDLDLNTGRFVEPSAETEQ